jgi:hypothetical protein
MIALSALLAQAPEVPAERIRASQLSLSLSSLTTPLHSVRPIHGIDPPNYSI